MSEPRPDAVPAWFERAVTVAILAVLGFGLVGLAAAVADTFEPWLVGPLGLVATVALVALDRRRRTAPDEAAPDDSERGAPDRVAQLAAIAVTAFIVASTAYGVTHAAQHVEINRDPGFYTNTAKWLERDGSLEVDAEVGPFVGVGALRYSEQGLPTPRTGVLHFQGDHLLPVLMAEGAWIAGDTGLFATPAVLGGLALAAVYLLAARRSSPLPALVATVALGGSVLWIAFARDAYTEVPSVALVAFALAKLPHRGAPTAGVAAQIGVALGGLCALRIDAPLLLALWPLVVAAWWFGPDRRAATRATRALLAGFAVALAVALADLLLRSPEYLEDLADRTAALWVLLVGAALATAAVVAVAPLRRAVERVAGAWVGATRLRLAAAGAVAVAAAGLWFVRPRVETVRGTPQPAVENLQRLLGLAVEPTRKYSEWSFAWQSWYLGPLLVALGVGGIALAVAHRAVGRRLAATICCAAPASLLYLYRPNIFPDHAWVMRRFLTTLTVVLVVGAAVALDALLRVRRVPRAPWLAAVLVLALATVALPLRAAAPVRAAADQRGFVDAIEQTCDHIGPDAAIVVIRDVTDALYQKVPQALRGWCGVPVAIAGRSLTPSVRRELARAWADQGVTLYLLGSDAADVAHVCEREEGRRFRAENRFLLEQTLTVRPSRYSSQSLEYEIFTTVGCG